LGNLTDIKHITAECSQIGSKVRIKEGWNIGEGKLYSYDNQFKMLEDETLELPF